MWKTAMLLIVFISFPPSVFSWDETILDTVETRYSNGHLHESYQTVFWGGNESTTKTGFYRSWYENGQIEWDGQYENDLKTHTWIRWDSTGRRINEVSYRAGNKHGSEIEWNPSGTIRKELHYRDGKMHGLCTWYTGMHTINAEYNNKICTIEAQRFYVDGMMLLPIRDTTDKPCVGGLVGGKKPYHNIGNDLWIEWDKEKRSFYTGHKSASQKHGVWIRRSASGHMDQVEVFDNGRLLAF